MAGAGSVTSGHAGHDDHGDHANDHHGKSQHGPAAAWIIFGLVACAMLFAHLVNSSDHHVKGSSYKLLSHIMSILGAILLFHCVKDASLLLVTGGDPDTHGPHGHGASSASHASASASAASVSASHVSASASHHLLLDLGMQTRVPLGMVGTLFSNEVMDYSQGPPPSPEDQIIAVIRFAVAFLMLELLLRVFKLNHHRLASVGLIGAHFTGFVAADTFGMIQESAPWNKQVSMSWIWVLISAATLFILKSLCAKVRQVMNDWDGEVDETEEDWEHQCVHSENEFVAFALGLVITQACRFTIMGSIPHFHGNQRNLDTRQVHSLGACCWLFIGLALALTFLPESIRHLPLVDTTRLTLSMTAGWSTTFWMKWTFWNVSKGELEGGDTMIAQLVMAVCANFVGCFVVLLLGKLQTRFAHMINDCFVEEMQEASVLVIGLAWEGVFMCAIYFANQRIPQRSVRMLENVKLCIILMILVLPVWHMYILPKSIELNDAHHGHGHGEKGHDAHEEGHGAHEKGHGAHDASDGHGDGDHGTAGAHEGHGSHDAHG